MGFIEPLQLITTSKDFAFTVLHTTQITVGHTRSSQSVTLFTSCSFVAASMADPPLPLGSRIVSGLSYQLLTATAHND
jgi:hypothetical protein